MSIVVRDVREHELDSILALNNAAGPAILPLDAARLRRFFDTAEYFRVAVRDGTLSGFLVGFGSESGHDSSNFRWFGERYERSIELAERSLRENCLHTPTLRTLAAAQVMSGRLREAEQTMQRLRALEPRLTVSVFRARYPGRDSPQAERFAAALASAGLPA